MNIKLIPTMFVAALLLLAVLASCRTKPEASRTEPNKPSQASPTPRSQTVGRVASRAPGHGDTAGAGISNTPGARGATRPTSPESDSAIARLVWSGSMWFHQKVVSPDGRYLAFIDW